MVWPPLASETSVPQRSSSREVYSRAGGEGRTRAQKDSAQRNKNTRVHHEGQTSQLDEKIKERKLHPSHHPPLKGQGRTSLKLP